MPVPQQIIFTVTNELNYDQRMIRICNTLHTAGYKVTLVGRRNSTSSELFVQPFEQKRLSLFFKKGPAFYIEYNTRLFFFLLFKKCDCICAIDLDTILPVYFAARLKRKKRVYDAHEYFPQLKEVVTRPAVYKIWYTIEKKMLPLFQHGYTVSSSIAKEFYSLYGVKYPAIRNIPFYIQKDIITVKEKNIIYQGAVNEARGFEFLIPAMKSVDSNLLVYGDGNFMEQAIKMVEDHNLHHKIIFKGKLLPQALEKATAQGYIGINLVENDGLNQYYSLANKFFDYIQHAVPQVTMNFPEYRLLNDEYKVALLINDLNIQSVADALSRLLNDEKLYTELQQNCLAAARQLNWQNEEKKLLAFYKNLFG